jgi:hypothetical protein
VSLMAPLAVKLLRDRQLRLLGLDPHQIAAFLAAAAALWGSVSRLIWDSFVSFHQGWNGQHLWPMNAIYCERIWTVRRL